MKILFLSFYFEPDLSAGSFRNSSLVKELQKNINSDDKIDLFTTFPNRYDSFRISNIEAKENICGNINVHRVELPKHKGSFKGQIKSFFYFFKTVRLATKSNQYDIVYASSSKLFTAFLGANIARKKKAKLYLDIRDIFRESIKDLFENKIVQIGLDLFLKPIEYYTFNRADHINLVSKGFKSYFDKYKKPSYSFFTNGIDDIFIEAPLKNNLNKREKLFKEIIYAGNIGEGQGLQNIIPELAKGLSDEYKITIYGDGGTKEKLIRKLQSENIKNVTINSPIKRNELIEKYKQADFLFMHLNDYKAFERVLPSKLFEYGALNKPIIAGVGGYAAEFLEENMSNLLLFKPCDFKAALRLIKDYQYKTKNRKEFIEKFNRKNINKKMILSILKLKN